MPLSSVLSRRADRLTFRATDLDLLLALAATFLLPLACSVLLDATGALLPLALYYGAFCVLLVRWRKGTLDYVRPVTWVLPLFAVLLAVQVVGQVAALMTIVPRHDDAMGVLLTFIIWVPLNAFSEQLLWVYIYDAFETRWQARGKRIVGGLLGMLLAVMFVGLIHALFWGSFLPEFRSTFPWFQVFFTAQTVMTIGYVLLYRRTGSMIPLFLLHIIADAALVLGGMYSMVPDLWTL